MGMTRSDTAALKFDDVPVPDDAILGQIGSADKVARRVLLRGRIGVGALALGLARDSLERAVAYAKGRKVAGGPLFDQPLTRAKLFRMEGNIWAAWQGVRSAAQLADHGEPFKLQACMAKVFATETALRVSDEAVQILGGNGYRGDYRVEQNYRDARLLTIEEGASEILRFAIARSLWAPSAKGGADLPSVENVPEAAGPYRGSMSDLWGLSWEALRLASESVHIVHEQIEQEAQQARFALTWQTRAVQFADIATRLWVSIQVSLTGARLVGRGHGSQNLVKRVKTLLSNASIEICHEASEFLRTLGRTDARLLSNYVETLQIAARLNLEPPVPIPLER
jgi:hypothetical protein